MEESFLTMIIISIELLVLFYTFHKDSLNREKEIRKDIHDSIKEAEENLRYSFKESMQMYDRLHTRNRNED